MEKGDDITISLKKRSHKKTQGTISQTARIYCMHSLYKKNTKEKLRYVMASTGERVRLGRWTLFLIYQSPMLDAKIWPVSSGRKSNARERRRKHKKKRGTRK